MLTVAYPGIDSMHWVKKIDFIEIPNWHERKWLVSKALNDVGREGWELVEVVWRTTGNSVMYDPIYILKRPIP